MPIPPRPIPTPNRARPGSSVPRKSFASSQLHQLDWRSELSLLGDLPRSAPSNAGGIRVVDKDQMVRENKVIVDHGVARREVGIEGLMVEGKGRVKKSTTATTLGFDFIANPSVIALPDQTTRNNTSSLLTASRGDKDRISPLSNTPTTPALLPTHSITTVDEQDDDEGWEHVPSSPHREEVDHLNEDDLIIWGELELDDELDAVDVKREVKNRPDEKEKGKKGLSYAAALGMSKA